MTKSKKSAIKPLALTKKIKKPKQKERQKRQKQKFLVTDCDGTFLVLSLLLFLIEILIELRIGNFKPEIKKLWEKEYFEYLNNEGTYDAYINKVVEVFLLNIAGLNEYTITCCAKIAVEKYKSRVRIYTRDLILNCKEDYFLILLSHSPNMIVELFAKAWGFDVWVGTNYITDENGIYTGKAILPHKGEKLAELIEEHHLTLTGSIAIGDTTLDIPMFEKVDRAICINPPWELLQIAMQKSWKVVVEYRDTFMVMPDGKALGVNFYQLNKNGS